MWLRFLRFGLFTCALAALSSLVMPRKARVYADDISPGNHCVSHAVAYAYYYGDRDPYNGATSSTGMILTTTPCLRASQVSAINVAGRSCWPVSRGTYVSRALVTWDVFWNEEYQGTVDWQPYDCGEFSAY